MIRESSPQNGRAMEAFPASFQACLSFFLLLTLQLLG